MFASELMIYIYHLLCKRWLFSILGSFQSDLCISVLKTVKNVIIKHFKLQNNDNTFHIIDLKGLKSYTAVIFGFSNYYNFLIHKYHRPYIFQIMNSDSSNNYNLKYQRFTPSGFKDIEIRKCVTKTRLIYDIRWLFTSLNLCILITITLNYIIIKEILQYSNLIIFFYHYTFFIVFYVGYIFMHRRARYLFPVLSIVTECI